MVAIQPIAASTFGPVEPAANWLAASDAAPTREAGHIASPFVTAANSDKKYPTIQKPVPPPGTIEVVTLLPATASAAACDPLS